VGAFQVFLLAAVAISFVGAVYDLRTGEIPNWITLAPLAGAIVAHFVWGLRAAGVMGAFQAAGFSISGALVCGIVPFVLRKASPQAMGGGDVKLLLAIGALCRTVLGIEAEFWSFIVAAVFAPAWLAWHGKLLQTLGNTFYLAANPFLPKAKRRALSHDEMTPLRFGPAIFVGTALTVAMAWQRGAP
jgi:prepilin peptidase CpaA